MQEVIAKIMPEIQVNGAGTITQPNGEVIEFTFSSEPQQVVQPKEGEVNADTLDRGA